MAYKQIVGDRTNVSMNKKLHGRLRKSAFRKHLSIVGVIEAGQDALDALEKTK